MMRKKILQLAAANQLQFHPLALKALLDELARIGTDSDKEWLLKRLFQAFVERESPAREISVDSFEQCLNTAKGDSQRLGSAFLIVPLSKVPNSAEKMRAATDKFTALRQRFAEVQSRCNRSGSYRQDDGRSSLLNISSLDGQDASVEVTVVGVLHRREDGWTIEDPSNELHLDTTILEDHSWLLEGLVVAVTGFAHSGKLQASCVALPPSESREDSTSFYRGQDLFGMAPHDVHLARQQEERASQSAVCVLSDINLDSRECRSSLTKFFSAFESRSDQELDQLCFVLVGNFSSAPIVFSESCHVGESSAREEFRQLLENFGSLVTQAAHSVSQHATFVFVPGPNDPTPVVGVLPVPPLSSLLVPLSSRLRHVLLAPNPCRLRFFTTEIVICRRDFQRELSLARGCVADQSKPYETIAKLVCSSGHLAPLSQSVLWKLDHTLQLPVLPHLLVLCDRSDQWTCTLKDCQIVNPGCFGSTGTFLWFTPTDKEASINRIS